VWWLQTGKNLQSSGDDDDYTCDVLDDDDGDQLGAFIGMNIYITVY
jgi:hypothetical protein